MAAKQNLRTNISILEKFPRKINSLPFGWGKELILTLIGQFEVFFSDLQTCH